MAATSAVSGVTSAQGPPGAMTSQLLYDQDHDGSRFSRKAAMASPESL